MVKLLKIPPALIYVNLIIVSHSKRSSFKIQTSYGIHCLNIFCTMTRFLFTRGVCYSAIQCLYLSDIFFVADTIRVGKSLRELKRQGFEWWIFCLLLVASYWFIKPEGTCAVIW